MKGRSLLCVFLAVCVCAVAADEAQRMAELVSGAERTFGCDARTQRCWRKHAEERFCYTTGPDHCLFDRECEFETCEEADFPDNYSSLYDRDPYEGPYDSSQYGSSPSDSPPSSWVPYAWGWLYGQ